MVSETEVVDRAGAEAPAVASKAAQAAGQDTDQELDFEYNHHRQTVAELVWVSAAGAAYLDPY